MRILIIGFFTDWIAHLGTELEIAQQHLNEGHRVDFLLCDGSIGGCRANPEGTKSVCDQCIYRHLKGIRLLKGQVEVNWLGDFITPGMKEAASDSCSGVKSVADAKCFDHAGHDLGWGALSSTIHETRDPFCSSTKSASMLAAMVRAAVLAYEGVKHYLKIHPDTDKAYIFNGRFACTRGAFRACQETARTEAVLHERGSSNEKYAMFSGGLLHERESWKARIEQSWNDEPDPRRREEIGRLFFEERRSGTEVAWKSFISQQRRDQLPDGFNPRKTNIAIFNSSEDEFAAIGDEWRNHVYPMQSEGIRRITADSLEQYPEYHFYLRMHPNLQGVDNEDTRRIRSLQHSNLTIIEPDSPISTYSLLDASDMVISFGSTIGVEATFWGKPSIMAGHSFYEHLGAVHCPQSHEGLMDMIGMKPEPCPTEGALKYGFHLRTFGVPFKYWRAEDFYRGSFMGTPIYRNRSAISRRISLVLSRAFRHDSKVVVVTDKLVGMLGQILYRLGILGRK